MLLMLRHQNFGRYLTTSLIYMYYINHFTRGTFSHLFPGDPYWKYSAQSILERNPFKLYHHKYHEKQSICRCCPHSKAKFYCYSRVIISCWRFYAGTTSGYGILLFIYMLQFTLCSL